MTLNDQFAFERLRQRVDDPHNKSVLIIIENVDGTLDTAYQGLEGNRGMFALAFSVSAQLSDEIMAEFTPEQRAASLIALPTREQAIDAGLTRFRRGKKT